MKTSVEIQNLKCGGCGTTIANKLNELEGVDYVLVEVEKRAVSIDYADKTAFEEAKKALAKLGYPLVDQKNTLGRKTRSYISCAMGKIRS